MTLNTSQPLIWGSFCPVWTRSEPLPVRWWPFPFSPSCGLEPPKLGHNGGSTTGSSSSQFCLSQPCKLRPEGRVSTLCLQDHFISSKKAWGFKSVGVHFSRPGLLECLENAMNAGSHLNLLLSSGILGQLTATKEVRTLQYQGDGRTDKGWINSPVYQQLYEKQERKETSLDKQICDILLQFNKKGATNQQNKSLKRPVSRKLL